MIDYLEAKGCRYSIAVTPAQAHRRADRRRSPRRPGSPVPDYPETGICELAETTYGGRRLIVRRVHLHAQDEQTELFAYWRHFAFLTNRSEDMHTVDAEHRQHAEVELAIRDLKDQALAHFPSGQLRRQRRLDGDRLPRPQPGALGRACSACEDETWRAARTIRRWLIALPGRLTRTARRLTLHLPARWPWQEAFVEALDQDQGAAGRGLILPSPASPHRPVSRSSRPARFSVAGHLRMALPRLAAARHTFEPAVFAVHTVAGGDSLYP